MVLYNIESKHEEFVELSVHWLKNIPDKYLSDKPNDFSEQGWTNEIQSRLIHQTVKSNRPSVYEIRQCLKAANIDGLTTTKSLNEPWRKSHACWNFVMKIVGRLRPDCAPIVGRSPGMRISPG